MNNFLCSFFTACSPRLGFILGYLFLEGQLQQCHQPTLIFKFLFEATLWGHGGFKSQWKGFFFFFCPFSPPPPSQLQSPHISLMKVSGMKTGSGQKINTAHSLRPVFFVGFVFFPFGLGPSTSHHCCERSALFQSGRGGTVSPGPGNPWHPEPS